MLECGLEQPIRNEFMSKNQEREFYKKFLTDTIALHDSEKDNPMQLDKLLSLLKDVKDGGDLTRFQNLYPEAVTNYRKEYIFKEKPHQFNEGADWQFFASNYLFSQIGEFRRQLTAETNVMDKNILINTGYAQIATKELFHKAHDDMSHMRMEIERQRQNISRTHKYINARIWKDEIQLIFAAQGEKLYTIQEDNTNFQAKDIVLYHHLVKQNKVDLEDDLQTFQTEQINRLQEELKSVDDKKIIAQKVHEIIEDATQEFKLKFFHKLDEMATKFSSDIRGDGDGHLFAMADEVQTIKQDAAQRYEQLRDTHTKAAIEQNKLLSNGRRKD